MEESVPLFAPLLSLPLPENHYPPLNLSPQRQRQKTLETLVAILLELAEHQPVLFILEDLHWTDPTTLELLNLVIEQIPTASILTVLTCRPTFSTGLDHRSYLTEITVNRLSHAQVEQIVTRMTDGKTLPPEVLQQIIDEDRWGALVCRGNDQSHSGIRTSQRSRWALRTDRVVLHVRHSSHPARFADGTSGSTGDRQSRGAICARSLGGNFRMICSRRSHNWTKPPYSGSWDRLVEAEIVYQRGVPPQATYLFKHALIQDAAYRVAAEEHAAAVSSADCAGAWKRSSQRPLRHSPNCWRITTPKRAHRAGHPLLAAGGPARAAALGVCGSGRAPDAGVGRADDAAGDARARPSRSWTCRWRLARR